ncbi:unnamed protein product [Leptidea sinapis]|uniref:Uncharacterized protein n=1 Tax=Leptidea sinapis TaxID=189913 RepID=A0A5E4QT76_9NEOP|nr:unnamed protein product [Leptidea sinapis]
MKKVARHTDIDQKSSTSHTEVLQLYVGGDLHNPSGLLVSCAINKNDMIEIHLLSDYTDTHQKYCKEQAIRVYDALARHWPFSSGLKWQKRRKILTPAFHFGVLKSFARVFKESSRMMVHELIQQLQNEQNVLNVMPFISDFTLSTICDQ